MVIVLGILITCTNRSGAGASLVFPCLVRNLYPEDVEEDEEEEKNKSDEVKELLSDACTEEVERTLRQRAVSVQLQPEVEEACR